VKRQRVAGFEDRQNDNWSGLLSIAELGGAHWLEQSVEAARALASEAAKGGEQDQAVLLLRHLREAFESSDKDFMLTEDILAALNRRDDGPWSELGPRGEGLSSTRLAARLREFGVKPK